MSLEDDLGINDIGGGGKFFSSNQLTGIQGGLGAIGLAGSIFGTLDSMQGANQKSAAQQQIARLEMQQDQVRKQAMEMSARRQQLQTVRTAQQSRAMALSAAVGQGAQFSSSAQSGQAQTAAQSAYAQQGVSQNLQFGEQMFALDNSIDQQKLLEAQAETKTSTGAGISSLFGDVTKSAGGISNLFSLIPAL